MGPKAEQGGDGVKTGLYRMQAEQLFKEARLPEAVRALGIELRDNPTDSARRTFLFELLCFSGEYERAGKQLDVLAKAGPQAGMAALVYRAALHAEQLRNRLFEKREYPISGNLPAFTGSVNGTRFETLTDADARIGPRLEVFAGGDYLWVPFAHIAKIEIQKPKRLRDLLWVPAKLVTGPGLESRDMGEVLLPAMTPLSWKHSDHSVRLGRLTSWEPTEEGELPVGQKMLIVDGEELPFLELRDLEIDMAVSVAS
jgi:type VI secretion system protein ImpE